jgi:8-oxo-dGTP diphosphatase
MGMTALMIFRGNVCIMELRLMATAVLFHGDELLMMERAKTRQLSPGMWAAVGGHVEMNELNHPMDACYREIEEETGLGRSDIEDLTLRYILVRRKETEIRQQMVYVGRTCTKSVIQTREGVLHWIPIREVFDREIPYIYRSLLEHYFRFGPSPYPWLGVAGADPETLTKPTVVWTPMIDFDLK